MFNMIYENALHRLLDVGKQKKADTFAKCPLFFVSGVRQYSLTSRNLNPREKSSK